jgi:hypothetical protein
MAEMKERVLTDEVRAALLGDMPFSSNSTHPFTPKHFLKKNGEDKYILPEEFRAVFDLKGMTKPQKQQGRKLLLKINKGLDQKEQMQLIELCRVNVVGWSNVFDLGTREEIEFKLDPEGGCDKDLFDRIPEAVVGQLFYEQTRISGLLDTTLLSLE